MHEAAPVEASQMAAPPPLTGPALMAVAVACALVTFIVVLDLTIANVSIPSIAAGLGASPREGTWVITSYAVAEAMTVLLSGWLSARFGTARVLVVSLLWFGAASALCGTAQSMDMLVICRLLQGIGGGPLVPLAQTALLTTFPKEKAAQALALWTVMAVIGPVAGPVVGGYICDHWSWPWIFLINVPFVLIGAYALWRLLGHRDAPPQRRPIDVIGMLLMATAVGATQFMLDRGHDLDWFESPLIVGLCIVSVLGFIAFVIWELTDAHPFIDLRMFRNWGFTIGLFVICLWFGPFFASVIISPLWLQTNMNYTPTWAGVAGAPTGLTMICLAPFVAWLSNRIDPRILVSLGFFIAANTFFWRGHFNSAATFELVLLAQCGVGVGMTCIFAPTLSIALDSLPPNEMASGTGMVSFMRTLAVGFATSGFVTYWQNAAVRNRMSIVDSFEGASAIGRIGATGLPHEQSLWSLNTIVDTQAVMMATNNTYQIFALLTTLGAICIWFAPRPTRGRKH